MLDHAAVVHVQLEGFRFNSRFLERVPDLLGHFHHLPRNLHRSVFEVLMMRHGDD